MTTPPVKPLKMLHAMNETSIQPPCPLILPTSGSTIANDIKVQHYFSKESPVEMATPKTHSIASTTLKPPSMPRYNSSKLDQIQSNLDFTISKLTKFDEYHNPIETILTTVMSKCIPNHDTKIKSNVSSIKKLRATSRRYHTSYPLSKPGVDPALGQQTGAMPSSPLPRALYLLPRTQNRTLAGVHNR
eukprot:1472240-Ditylum_brightwellii.AAC.1